MLFSSLLAVIPLASAHSFLARPEAGLRTGWGETCQSIWNRNSPCCAGLDKAKPDASKLRRGQDFEFQWPRNNHPAGFIRMAIVPLKDSTDQKNFDNNVIHYNCHESGCKSGYKDDPLGGDPCYEDHCNLCKNTLKIPTWLPNGQYTIQWIWFGGASYYGDKNRGQTSYQNCYDFTIVGDEEVAEKPGNFCPVFDGIDIHKNNAKQCMYFSQNEDASVMQCNPDGCQGQYRHGLPADVKRCVADGGSSTYPDAGSSKGNQTIPTSGSLIDDDVEDAQDSEEEAQYQEPEENQYQEPKKNDYQPPKDEKKSEVKDQSTSYKPSKPKMCKKKY